MSKPQVLICGDVIHAQEELNQDLGSIAEVLRLDSRNRSEFFTECKSGKFSKITSIYRHNSSASSIGFFDSELILNLPSTLKSICHNGAGYDQIDVEAAKQRNIWVSHTPVAVDDATADTAMWLTLSTLRQYPAAERNARKGNWKNGLKIGSDPEQKVLGILGMGGIGSALARRAQAFDMKILYHNRNPSSTASSTFTYVPTLKELLSKSDVVSLNLPLNASTEKSFGKEQFDQMKDGSILINTARGGVVDEEALLKAIESGKLGAAGLDVFPDEPNINERFFEFENVVILPHCGTFSKDTEKKMELQVFESIKSSLADPKYVPKYLIREHTCK